MINKFVSHTTLNFYYNLNDFLTVTLSQSETLLRQQHEITVTKYVHIFIMFCERYQLLKSYERETSYDFAKSMCHMYDATRDAIKFKVNIHF